MPTLVPADDVLMTVALSSSLFVFSQCESRVTEKVIQEGNSAVCEEHSDQGERY